MKFGSHLKAHRTSHWKFNFVDYDGLKAHLKVHTDQCEFTDEDEAQFIKLLKSELDKVAAFQSLKLGEVLRRTDHCEHTIEQHQSSSAKASERKLTLSSFVVTESEINKITQDVQDLARYQRLNYTAFLKILKKHDRRTGYILRSRFMNNWLNRQPFHKESFAPLVNRLSTLYNIVRTGNVPEVSKARSIDSSEEEEEELEQHPGYVPKKTAYWVHPDSVMDLKMLILKYLPLVVYEPTPALSSSHRSASSQMSTCLTSESPVSTVYLDNQDFELYMSQAEHRENAETVRLRWYGSESKQVWVEHQVKKQTAMSVPAVISGSAISTSSLPFLNNNNTNIATPTRTKSIPSKHRFQLKAKHIPNLVQGTAELGKVVQQMRLSGQKDEQEMKEFEKATRQVQSMIYSRRLQPVVQTFFNRTAFQVPGDARVRITIDTDVVMVRERRIIYKDENHRAYEQQQQYPWAPTELKAENYPFSSQDVQEQDIVRFPFAVMQIRTLTEPDEEDEDEEEEQPGWVDHIAQSPLVQLIPNFSKDLHAIATLYESRVSLLPFWLSDMDRDLRKSSVIGRSTNGGCGCGCGDDSTHTDSNSNSGSSSSSTGSSTGSSSNDTMTSNQSSTTTTASLTTMSSDTGLSRLFKMHANKSNYNSNSNSNNSINRMCSQQRARQNILDPKRFFSPGVTFEDEVLHELEQHNQKQTLSDHRVNLMTLMMTSSSTTTLMGGDTNSSSSTTTATKEASEAGSSNSSRSSSSSNTKLPKSCLKKHGSLSSLQSRNSSNDDLASSTSTLMARSGGGGGLYHGYGTTSLPHEADLEAQKYYYIDDNGNMTMTTTTTRSSRRRRGWWWWKRAFLRLFWTGVNIANMMLLFAGVLLAMMNFGDGKGIMEASLFLVVACGCVGAVMWAFLSRMNDDMEEGDDEEGYDGEEYDDETTRLVKNKNSDNSNKNNKQQRECEWKRTRLMPTVVFMCLSMTVAMNASVQMYQFDEEVGS